MHEFFIEAKVKKLILKIKKKDKLMHKIIMNKIQEVINCKNINHYKNLRKPMQRFKRVHIKGSFVLIFEFRNDKVFFYDLDHHDRVYQN